MVEKKYSKIFIVAILCIALGVTVIVYAYALPTTLYTLHGPIIVKATNTAWGNFIIIEVNAKNHRAVTHLTDAAFTQYHIGQTVHITRICDAVGNQWDLVIALKSVDAFF